MAADRIRGACAAPTSSTIAPPPPTSAPRTLAAASADSGLPSPSCRMVTRVATVLGSVSRMRLDGAGGRVMEGREGRGAKG